MENRRNDDPPDSHYSRQFSNERYFKTIDGWFYETRLMGHYGPFATKEIAVEDCTKRYITKVVNHWTF